MTSTEALIMHKKTHRNEDPHMRFKCNLCPYSTNITSNIKNILLSILVKVHTSVKCAIRVLLSCMFWNVTCWYIHERSLIFVMYVTCLIDMKAVWKYTCVNTWNYILTCVGFVVNYLLTLIISNCMNFYACLLEPTLLYNFKVF